MLDTLALRALVALLVFLGLTTAGMYYGHTRYKEGVRVTRLQWDTDRAAWQSALDKQKMTAQAMLASAQADADAATAKAVKAAAQQEKDYATYMAGTAALAAQYAARGLRYAAPASTARCGAGSGPAVPGAASQAGSGASTVVQLPDPIAGNLRQFATDAENLRNDYRKCVAAVNGGPSL